jgi:sulfite reductase alpha subunit-like flavoprotein
VLEQGEEERLQKHAEQLQKLLASGDAAIEAYFQPRHVLDVLRDFDTARPTVEQVRQTLSLAPTMMHGHCHAR